MFIEFVLRPAELVVKQLFQGISPLQPCDLWPSRSKSRLMGDNHCVPSGYRPVESNNRCDRLSDGCLILNQDRGSQSRASVWFCLRIHTILGSMLAPYSGLKYRVLRISWVHTKVLRKGVVWCKPESKLYYNWRSFGQCVLVVGTHLTPVSIFSFLFN